MKVVQSNRIYYFLGAFYTYLKGYNLKEDLLDHWIGGHRIFEGHNIVKDHFAPMPFRARRRIWAHPHDSHSHTAVGKLDSRGGADPAMHLSSDSANATKPVALMARAPPACFVILPMHALMA